MIQICSYSGQPTVEALSGKTALLWIQGDERTKGLVTKGDYDAYKASRQIIRMTPHLPTALLHIPPEKRSLSENHEIHRTTQPGRQLPCPKDMAEKEDLETFQKFLHQFGELLTFWPTIFDSAKKLNLK